MALAFSCGAGQPTRIQENVRQPVDRSKLVS